MAILPEGNALDGFLANLTGYRAQPNLTEALVFALDWVGIVIAMRAPARPPAH